MRYLLREIFSHLHISGYVTLLKNEEHVGKSLHHECDELEGRSAREMVIHALFGFFTQQVVLFTHRTCTYIGKIDNARHSSVAVTEEKAYRVKHRERDR
jgi:hypothetical protein